MKKFKKVITATIVLTAVFCAVVWAGGEKESTQKELVVWLSGEPGTVNSYSKLFQEYAEQQDDLTLEVTFIGSDLFNPTLVPALSSGEGPDVFQFGTGPGQPAAIIDGKLVKDLTPYYFKKGWDKVIPSGVVMQTSSDGKLWAIGDQVETTMMFYNTKIFNEYGLQIPKTIDDLHAIANKLQEEGYETPIGLGGADRWPISHWQSMAFGRFAGPEGIERVMFGDGRWDAQEFVSAAGLIQNFAERGYFGKNPNAVGYAEIMDAFWAGEIPMTFTGPWVIGDAIRSLGDDIQNFEVFQLPPLSEGQKIYPTESIGGGWYINDSSKHPDVAADMLDYVFFRDETRKQLLQSGDTIPVGPIEHLLTDVDLPQLREQMLSAVDKYRGNGTVPAFLDTVQPAGTTEAVYNGLQALVAGEITPEKFVADIQTAWAKDKANGLILKKGGVAQP
jgi:raffinose/stachyose/melibiose transport system substrate-binding protein